MAAAVGVVVVSAWPSRLSDIACFGLDIRLDIDLDFLILSSWATHAPQNPGGFQGQLFVVFSYVWPNPRRIPLVFPAVFLRTSRRLLGGSCQKNPGEKSLGALSRRGCAE